MKPNSNKGQVVNKFKTYGSCGILLLLTINVFFFLGGGVRVMSGGSIQELRLRKIN
jgi:hypothetical protein